jgi:carotenoid cleavage dioxygenase-like enzyme
MAETSTSPTSSGGHSTRGQPPAGPSSSPALGFSTLEDEVVLDALALSGEVPAWLAGSLLRTGPAKFEVGARGMRHWFDGLAMLHRFTFEGGRVSYASRFLRSAAYRAARERGEIAYSEFATDPCRSLFRRVQSLFAPTLTDNANLNVGQLGARLIAMTETPMPLEFDPVTLQTAGVAYTAPGQLTTAHPHLDRATGAMLNYAARLGPRSSYRFFTVGPDLTPPRMLASLPVSEPAYIHSFGLTERWIVLAEFPLVVNPLRLALSGRPYIENYRWKPERGTRFTLVDRATGQRMTGFETDPCFAFHHVNAYDDGDDVVVDVCAYPDSQIIEDLYLERLRAGKPASRAHLRRFRLSVGDRHVTSRPLGEGWVELPRINYAHCNGRCHRFVWGVDAASGWIDRIMRVDTEAETATHWSQTGCYPGEPVFVARPNADREDDGVLLSVVLDAGRGTSALLVLDAQTLEQVARAEVPTTFPSGSTASSRARSNRATRLAFCGATGSGGVRSVGSEHRRLGHCRRSTIPACTNAYRAMAQSG